MVLLGQGREVRPETGLETGPGRTGIMALVWERKSIGSSRERYCDRCRVKHAKGVSRLVNNSLWYTSDHCAYCDKLFIHT